MAFTRNGGGSATGRDGSCLARTAGGIARGLTRRSAEVHPAGLTSELKSPTGPRCVNLSGLTIELMLVICPLEISSAITPISRCCASRYGPGAGKGGPFAAFKNIGFVATGAGGVVVHYGYRVIMLARIYPSARPKVWWDSPCASGSRSRNPHARRAGNLTID